MILFTDYCSLFSTLYQHLSGVILCVSDFYLWINVRFFLLRLENRQNLPLILSSSLKVQQVH